MPTRQRKLRKAARIAGKSYTMSSYTESLAIEAAVENAGGGSTVAPGYPQVTTKLPVYVAPGGSIQNGDVIIAMGGSYTFEEGGWGFDEWVAQHPGDFDPKKFNGDVFSPLYTTSHGNLFPNLDVLAEPLMMLGVYNGPTILDPTTDPDAWEAAGGNVTDRLILLDVIMSGEAEFIPSNEYNLNIGNPLYTPKLISGATHPSCGKMDADSRYGSFYHTMTGWYVSDVDGPNGVFKAQVAPGIVTMDGTGARTLSDEFKAAIHAAHGAWPEGWSADPF